MKKMLDAVYDVDVEAADEDEDEEDVDQATNTITGQVLTR
jgi:hypothetical protein